MKKRNKVSKNVFIAILFMELIIVADILFFIISDYYSSNFGKSTIVCIVLLLCFGIIIAFLFRPLFKQIFEVSEIRKESKMYVQKNLSKYNCVEVIPIKDDPQHEGFVTKELVKRAKFYAQIMSDGTVMISIKFNNEDTRIYYGGLYAENFTTHFKVINL